MSTTAVTIGPDSLTLQRSVGLVRAVGNITDALGLSYAGTTLVPGVATGQVDTEYCLFGQTIAPLGTLLLNLKSLTDQFGNAISFARLKRVYVDCAGASAVALGGAGQLPPTVAPVLGQTVTGGGLSNGAYVVAYSWVTAAGETQVSPISTITLTGGGAVQTITVGVPALPAGVTSYSVYMSLTLNGLALARIATAQVGLSYSIVALPPNTNAAIPYVNTALTGVKSIFNGVPDSQLAINKGECFYLGTDPGAAGHVVPVGNANLLVTNLDAVNVATCNVEISGCSS